MEIQEKVGERLRELRNKKGLSQEKFGLVCELDRTYIASIEHGKRNISIVNLQKICKALGVSLSYFFRGIE